MILLLAQNDINLGKQKTILVGGVDEWIPKPGLAKKLLGVDEATVLGEGSNWLLIGAEAEGAHGTFAIEPKTLDKAQLQLRLSSAEAGTWLSFSSRFSDEEAAEIMVAGEGCRRYLYEASCAYYETSPLYVLNRFLAHERGRLIHVDVCQDRYMVMGVDNLRFPS